MNKITTATATWITWNNFGSLLQAYALQNRIESLGYDNRILDDYRITKVMEDILAPKKRGFFKIFLSNIKGMLVSKIKYNNSKYYIVKDLYDDFRRNQLKIDSDWKESNVGDKYDEYICGSDQIWTPSKTNQPFYFLNFTNRKKIAYSVSVGTKVIPEDFKNKVEPYVSKFSAISVREKTAMDLIQPLNKKIKIECTLDPTLLLTGEQWKENLNITSKGKEEKFILVYLLTYNRNYIKLIKEFARRNSLRTKIFVTRSDINYHDFDEQILAGPKEFVKNISKSTYFFTDSFHGTVFSLLLHKKFFTLQRFPDNTQDNQNARLRNLFDLVHVNQRFLNEENFNAVYRHSEIDYTKIDSILASERLKSMDYLKKALSD